MTTKFEIGKMYVHSRLNNRPSRFKHGETIVILDFCWPEHKSNIFYGSGSFKFLTEKGEIANGMIWLNDWKEL